MKLAPLICALLVAGCATVNLESHPPDALVGAFVDDYEIVYSISADRWVQHPNAVYHITSWNEESQYLIAQNVPGNATDGSLWTRIDWITLEGMEPYSWAFCLSAFDAPSAEAAERVQIADRADPLRGCNGFPFSRMKRNG